MPLQDLMESKEGKSTDFPTEGKVVDESDDDEPKQVQFKVILLGDGAVGKTSLAMRYSQDSFKKSYKQTIGVDFFIKRLKLPGGLLVALQIWDIGGQSIGSKMLSNYIYGADAILLCYDITNYQSFRNLEDWYHLVRKTFTGSANIPYVALIGNKMDLVHMKAVDSEQHEMFADENDFKVYSVSAKSAENVCLCFNRIAADLAGIVVVRPEMGVAHEIVRAEIIQHNNDASKVPVDMRRTGKSKCVIS